MNEAPTPVDIAMANLDHRRRYLWDDAFAQYRELTQEEQELRDQRHRRQRRH